MPGDSFTFKQFEIRQDRCAMKVSTDGVLLGAWTDIEGCRSMLDIGTGTGLVALMAAQRAQQATVEAVEIDTDAAQQARENVARSPFASRITIVAQDFQSFATQAARTYDALLCNPPFFTQSLRCPDATRAVARHDDTLSLDELARGAARLLPPEGTLNVILPFDRRADMIAAAATQALLPHRETHVSTLRGKLPKRILMSFSASARWHEPDILCIDEKPGQHTMEYIRLVRDFYLEL